MLQSGIIFFMIDIPAAHIPFKPQSIILITRIPLRQDAIKALLGIILIDIPLFVAANYAAARQFLVARKYSKTLVVVDGWSLDDQSLKGANLLKKEFPETRCLLLSETAKDQAISCYLEPDEILAGSITGNQFINVIRDVIERDS